MCSSRSSPTETGRAAGTVPRPAWRSFLVSPETQILAVDFFMVETDDLHTLAPEDLVEDGGELHTHHGRLCSEAAFAALAGVAPIPTSSGQVIRHRLNRGGDRQLNRAIHTIVMWRTNFHSESKAYLVKRRREGKTDREIRRCLKRHLARRVFKLLQGLDSL